MSESESESESESVRVRVRVCVCLQVASNPKYLTNSGAKKTWPESEFLNTNLSLVGEKSIDTNNHVHENDHMSQTRSDHHTTSPSLPTPQRTSSLLQTNCGTTLACFLLSASHH